MKRGCFRRFGGTPAACLLASLTVGLAGCATESSRTLPVEASSSAARPYEGAKNNLIVAKFDNRST